MQSPVNNPGSRFIDGGTGPLGQRPQLPGEHRADSEQKAAISAVPEGGSHSKPQALLESKIPLAPSIGLPKGGGAIQGLGEKFDVNASNGTATLSVPIKVPPGRSGMQPNLSLKYDSAAGNGEFGLGWRLSGVDSITRKTAKGLPRYNDHGSDDDADLFLLAGSEDLVPLWKCRESGEVVTDDSGRPLADEVVIDGYCVRTYAPRIVTSFNRVERWTRLADREDIHWRVISPENVTGVFGSSDSSRIYDTGAAAGMSRRIFSWLQDEVYDSRGNAVIFSYKREDSSSVNFVQSHELHRSDDSRRANLYLKKIQYGNVVPNRDPGSWEPFTAHSLPQDRTWKFSVVLDYGEHSPDNPKPDDAGAWMCRRDPFSRYISGFEIRTYRLCHRFLVFHHFEELPVPDYLVSSIDLTYDENPTASYLVSAQLAGYTSRGSSGSTAPLRKSLPPMEFGYSHFPSDEELARLPVEHIDSPSAENLPIGLDGQIYRWVDLDGEGSSGVLAAHGHAWYYKRNTSASNYCRVASPDGSQANEDKLTARFGPLEAVTAGPFLTSAALNMQFGDVDGNGKLDLISRFGSQWGYFERDQDETLGWTEFRSFRNFPSIKFDREVQFVDLTGDGFADVLIHQDHVYTWFPSEGREGYGLPQSLVQDCDETRGPVCVFADSEQRIYLADMSGDGMADLCRIRNGDCCYWPQLGYGRFGSQICFDNAPWLDYNDQFSNSRVRLADFDGSGTTDIAYLTNDGVEIYRNQSGNSFSNGIRISLPELNSGSSLDIVDLLGNGTQCLVWSSPLPGNTSRPMAYIDIFRNKKPHLLTGTKNNLGRETRIHYAPSTKFYVEDKQSGRPWITRLPFPVQCIERTETIDHVSGNVFASSYRYAHGFYDGVEREFRGFARVEQTDTSNFSSLKGVSPTNANPAWSIPPVRTVTWFHTGAYFNQGTMSEALSQEYFRDLADASSASPSPDSLDHTILPPECMEGVHQMEACRTLKGRLLRSETYSEDGSDKARIPYSVSEANYSIVPKQLTQDRHGHGVYFIHARESITYSYERVLEDPRVTHQMVLEVDAFGNPVKELRISYGRRPNQSQLSPADAAKQEAIAIIYNEADFTNSFSGKSYRAPVPCESRQYEIRGLKPKDGDTRFRYEAMVVDSFSAILSIPEISPEDEPGQKLPLRRLLRRERALFRADNLSGLLPVGTIEPLCLPGTYHKLAFTPGLFNKLYTEARPDGSQDTLVSVAEALEKGYVDVDGDGNLWTSSSKALYATDPTAGAAQELAEARSSFFLTKTILDIFDDPFHVDYDRYGLFPVRSRDALGNTVLATMDYRALQPAMVIDPNGNVSSAAYDAFGMVAGVAVSGKPSDGLGDTLDSFEADLSQEVLDAFIQNPTPSAAVSLLGNATTRAIYDPWRMRNTSTPIFSGLISRETHVNHSPPPGGPLFHVLITYADGFGRVIQEKIRTKAGPVVEGGPPTDDRWIATGWTLFNNKGLPVKQFEPFFDTTAAFRPDMAVGVSSSMLYDPLGRVAAVLHPNHTFEKIVFGPWHQQTFDTNDNVLVSDPRQDPHVGSLFAALPEADFLPSWYDSRKDGGMGKAERDTAAKTVAHSNTPKISHLDSLGRPFLVIADTGSEKIVRSADMDILNNVRVTRDGLGRKSIVADFDMCQRQAHSVAIDSGKTWSFVDGANQTCMTWNSRGFRFRIEYDKLRRQTKSWWRDAGASTEVLTAQIRYGEEFLPTGNESAEMHNLRGMKWQVLDQSGIVTNSSYDLDGNLTESRRKLAKIYNRTFDVSTEMALEDQDHTKSDSFDLLRRPVRSVAPDGTITLRIYNQSTLLDRVCVNIKGELDLQSDPSTWAQTIIDVNYNAKGQITSITYGNGTTTKRTYDRLTSRLQRLRTTKENGRALQDLTYTYDPVGNISLIQDASQQTIFFRNNVVDASNDYSYDAVYRLTSASGREHLGQANGPPTAPSGSDKTHNANGDQAGNGQAMGRYTETYKYDLAGNLLSVRHAGSDARSPGWTRLYGYSETSAVEAGVKSNRLSQTSVGTTTEFYKYEGSAGLTGNMTAMAHLPVMIWNFSDRLAATSKQVASQDGAQVPEMTYYVYDWQGQRVRKVTESQAGPNSRPVPRRQQERIYLGDYEVLRIYTGGNGTNAAGDGAEGSGEADALVPSLERTTFHASTEYGHIADICSRTVGDDDGTARQVRFQLHNHLGSAMVELDGDGDLLSYEEFFPFGSTSYRAAAAQTDVAKRYRYSGKELDDENGLYYFGARYLAAWLGRWTAADPVVGAAGSVYDFAANNPVRLVDPDGRQPWITVPSGGPMGTLVHEIIGPVLQARLLLRGIRSEVELPTLPGGSKNHPYDPDFSGFIDLVGLRWEPGHNFNQLSGHMYEFKPDNEVLDLRDSKALRYQKETWFYSQYTPRTTPNGLYEIVDPRPGSIIEEIDRHERATGLPASARLLGPVEFSLPGIDIRINLRLEDSGGGGKVAGLVLYQVQIRPKARQLRHLSRELAKELARKALEEIIRNGLDKYLDQIRNPPPLPQPESPPEGQGEKKPEQKPEQKPQQPHGLPAWAYVVGGLGAAVALYFAWPVIVPSAITTGTGGGATFGAGLAGAAAGGVLMVQPQKPQY